MPSASSRIIAGVEVRALQEALPGFVRPLEAGKDDAAAAFVHAVNALHAATARSGRARLSSDGQFRLQLRRAMARMTQILDATSAPVSTERSLDALLIELEDLQVASLARADRAALLGAVTVLDDSLRMALGDDAIGVLLEAAPVGPGLASLVFEHDPALLDPDTQLAYLQACERLSNGACARRDAAVVAFAGANPVQTRYWVDGDEHALTDTRALEMQAAMHWNQQYTHARIDTARALHALPETAEAYARGLIAPRTLDAIVDGAETLADPLDRAIESAVVGSCNGEQIDGLRQLRRDLLESFDAKLAAFATQHNPLNVSAKIRSTLVQLDPEHAAARRIIAVRSQSNVEYRSLPDGMAQLIATMAAEQALACMRQIEALAHMPAANDHDEPLGLRRVDVLRRLITHRPATVAAKPAAGEMDLAGMHGTSMQPELTVPSVGAHLDIVMDLGTVLGLADTTAEVIGVGPLPAHAARALLAESAYVKIRRLIIDPPTGHRIDTGVRRYVLTEPEQQRIFDRDRYCRFPDCTRRAIDCECDHAQPYALGGPSSAANLGALCKRHHQHKTHAGWTITNSADDGSCTWVSPLGRT